MRILKLTALQCPGIEDQIVRSYDSDFKSGMVDDVLDVTDYGTRLNIHTLSSVASSIIRPIGSREDSRIENGWQQSRFKIAMVVEVEKSKYSTEYCYVVGYTDHDEGSRRGSTFRFDPDTKIYFNTITRIDFRMHNHGRESVWQPKLNKYDQVLRRDSIQDDSRRHAERPSLLRPTDLFRRRDHEMTDNAALQALRKRADVDLVNNTGRFVQPIVLSSSNNNLSSSHLSRSINALVSASTDPLLRSTGTRDDGYALKGAVDRLDENLIEQDPLLDHLRRDSDILRSGYITIGELMDANPDFDEDDIQVGFADVEQAARYRDSARWDGDSPEQLAATLIANGLPTIMMNSMYSMADLILDTTARMGEPRVECTFGAPFIQGIDPMGTMQYFENTVEDILLREASNNFILDIVAHVRACIDEEIEIEITVDGGDKHFFVYPAWGNALLSPVLSSDNRSLDRVSRSITQLATDVATERNRRFSSHSHAPEISTSTDIGRARSERVDRKPAKDFSLR